VRVILRSEKPARIILLDKMGVSGGPALFRCWGDAYPYFPVRVGGPAAAGV